MKLQGIFKIENQVVDSQYSTVGHLNLKDGGYRFIPDTQYKLDDFENEFYFENPSGAYTIRYHVQDLAKVKDNETLATIDFVAINGKKHTVLLRFDKDSDEVYFHATTSRFETFKIAKPLQ